MTMYPCKGFDFTWADWLFALTAGLSPSARSPSDRVERDWLASAASGANGPGGGALACLTVRSAFDLYLRAKRWPAGSEVVFSALTVPDMSRIAAHHGLKPLALDIDPLTTRWDDAELERLIGPRTRAVVLAHLFGARVDIEPAIAIARRHDVAVLEDCAQAYAGTRFRGHPDADLALFSFGPMKTSTALGGAIAGVRCPSVLAEMRRLRDADPAQPTLEYWRRTVLYGVFKALTQPRLFGAFAKVADTLGTDREQWLHGLTRNVPPEDMITRLRRRPCAALLRVLHRRLASGDSLLKRRSVQGTVLADAIGAHVALPTRAAMPHGYWMVPVLPRDRRALVQGLRDAGFDAMSGRLATVEGNARGTPGAATLAEAVYVPFDPSIPRPALERLGALVTRLA